MGDTTLTAEQRDKMIERLALWVEAKGLRSPAVLFLEANKPIAVIGSHALLLLQPLFGFMGPVFGWFDADRVLAEYASLFEDAINVDRILARLEHPAAK